MRLTKNEALREALKRLMKAEDAIPAGREGADLAELCAAARDAVRAWNEKEGTTIKVFCFTEGEFESAYIFDTAEEARAFSSGFTKGGACYGAGSAAGYVEEDAEDEVAMAVNHDPAEVKKARNAHGKKL